MVCVVCVCGGVCVWCVCVWVVRVYSLRITKIYSGIVLSHKKEMQVLPFWWGFDCFSFMCLKGSDHEGAYPMEIPLPGMLWREIHTQQLDTIEKLNKNNKPLEPAASFCRASGPSRVEGLPASRGRELGKYSAGSVMGSVTARCRSTTGWLCANIQTKMITGWEGRERLSWASSHRMATLCSCLISSGLTSRLSRKSFSASPCPSSATNSHLTSKMLWRGPPRHTLQITLGTYAYPA